MNAVIQEILSYSIIAAVIAGFFRFKKVTSIYYPFLILVVLAFLNETVSMALLFTHHYNIVNTNIYTLLEALVIVSQFNRWELFNKKKKTYPLIIGGLGLLWLIDNLFLEGLTTKFNSYFIIVYSYLIVILSITQINKLIIIEKESLIRNAAFIICIGFIIFFTYATLVEIFWKYGFTKGGGEFTRYVYNILRYLNVFVNLIYALAILWMPKKPKFLLQS